MRAVLVLALLLLAGAARADDRWHGSAGGGGALRLNDPQTGAFGEVELWAPGRFGVRGQLLWLGGPVLLSGGIEYQLGGARPHLLLSLHGDAGGWIVDGGLDALDLAGGLRTQLEIAGPVALMLDTSFHVAVGSGDPHVALITQLGLVIGI